MEIELPPDFISRIPLLMLYPPSLVAVKYLDGAHLGCRGSEKTVNVTITYVDMNGNHTIGRKTYLLRVGHDKSPVAGQPQESPADGTEPTLTIVTL